VILQALASYYDRLSTQNPSVVPPYGYSDEQISFAIVLGKGGILLEVMDLRDATGKKPRPARYPVPQPVRRTSGVASNFLWDKSGYALGIARDKSDKTAITEMPEQFAAFRALHYRLLSDTQDEGLAALRAFLAIWTPSRFASALVEDAVVDTNLVFRLDGDLQFLHDRSAAKAIWARHLGEQTVEHGVCLVSGEDAPIARLHAAIKGVSGAQSSGASIVSFNLDAFASYGKEQGANAPVSERAAFAYTTALNQLLRPGEHNRHRLQIADASTVFWAEARSASEEPAAEAAEELFALLAAPPTDEEESARVRAILDAVEKGRPLAEAEPRLEEGTRFFVLGIAPNAARLSIRFWHVDTLGELAKRFREHWDDLAIEPRGWKTPPAIWRLLREAAAQGKGDNIPPNLAGEVMRAILSGNRYPRSLLTAIVMRCRADTDINGLRAAILKACLVRTARIAIRRKETVPVSLDRNELNPGYRLGRLFAVLESVQRVALGPVNATIRDRFYSAASTAPAGVFPLLLRTAGHHLSNIRKGEKAGLAGWFEKEMGDIIGGVATALPKCLGVEDQGRFAIGYYHQRYAKRSDVPADVAAEETTGQNGDEP
jgi:CRISPR-associated protein Csd1